jgi:hypothetical protein
VLVCFDKEVEMTVPSIIAVIGGVAFLVGLLGGGIKVENFMIPKLPAQVRIFSSVAGIICIVIAVWLFMSNERVSPSPMSSIKITKPVDQATVTCDTTLGTDQCYISVSGTAEIKPGFQICLFLKFQGAPDPWWVGGQMNADEIPNNKIWKVSHVGIGEVNAKYLPPLLITAAITDATCSIGTQFANLPEEAITTTIQVQRK